MTSTGKWLWVVLVAACLAGGARAQDRAAVVAEIREAYQALDYGGAETKARRALATYTDFTVDQLVEIHTLLGLVTFTLNKPEEARRQFEAALSLRENLELDPLFTSPKILAFFEQVKTEWQARNAGTPPPGSIQYIQIEDRRAGAAMRSLLLPGWGQHYKGERRKGWILMGLWGLTASGTVMAHLLRRQAEDRYLKTTDPALFDRRFDTLNTWHKVRNNLALATLGVWAYSYVDALLFRAPFTPAQRRNLVVLPAPAPGYARVTLHLRF